VHGESIVAQYLEDRGFSIVASNYQRRTGEIDLIARKAEVVAFVEVKSRRNCHFNLSEVITPAKQRKIIKTAQRFILENGLFDTVYRFDVALVELENTGDQVTYIENAYTL
jgi:putative endonuclease